MQQDISLAVAQVWRRQWKKILRHFPNTLRNAWERAREDAGIPWFKFHDLRHTGLTIFAQQGATLAELLHRGGHSDVDVALRYQHATRERDAALAARMDSHVLI